MIGEVVAVTDTQIIITEEKQRSGGKVTFNPFQITRKVDKASPTLFQIDPSSSGSFLGGGVSLLTLTSSEVAIEQVDLTPSVGDQLIVDVTFAGPSAPDPATWAMMLVGFAGLGYAGYRRRQASVRA